MSIKISFKTPVVEKNIKNYVLFANENFEINGLSKLTLNKHSNLIKKTINSNKSKNRDFLTFNFNSSQKITLINLKKDYSSLNNEKIGAKFYRYLKDNFLSHSTFLENNVMDIKLESMKGLFNGSKILYAHANHSHDIRKIINGDESLISNIYGGLV